MSEDSAESIASPLPPGSRWGTLEILEHAGGGSFAQSYRARDTRLDREVVLTILIGSSSAGQILREARLLAGIRHPNLVMILGADEIAGAIGIWCEFLRGQTLDRMLQERGVWEAREAALVGIDLCRALSAVHGAGLIHRNVQLSNILRAEGGRIVLGSSGSRDRDDLGMFTLSMLFTAPELLEGGPGDPRSDLYSLGAVLFALTTGSVPIEAATLEELRSKHARGERREARDLRSDLHASLVRFLQRALAPDPEARFANAGEAEKALRAVLDEPVFDDGARDATGLERSRTAAPTPHRLPAEVDAFVGRETELQALSRRFGSHSRLVTLQGAGGIGKTRLAIRYGWSSLDSWPGGVWFCDLSKARNIEGIAAAVGEGIGVPLGAGDAMAQLGHAIASRGQCLVILDNFEQVVEHAADTVWSWSARAPEARFLVTSRERLKVQGEDVQPIDPLSLERGVELFLDRARLRRPIEIDGPEGSSVREVVRLMDGIPLAIELAAARLPVMTPAQMADRISERFRLLAGSGAGRHATLRAAIDGSWELLQPWEKAAFAQCAVFEGGFTLDAAESVLDLSPWPGAPWMVDVIQSLVDKSMLRSWVARAESDAVRAAMRFGTLVSLQDYAREKLSADGQVPGGMSGASVVEAIERRHAEWFARFGQDDAIEALELHGGVERRRILAEELDNLMAACRRMIRRDEGKLAIALYRAASAVIDFKGPHAVAVQLGAQLEALTMDPEDRARLLLAFGNAHMRTGGLADASSKLEESLAIQRQLGNRRSEGRALAAIGSLRIYQGKIEEARELLEAALAIHREVGDRRSEGEALGNLGIPYFESGRLEEAGAFYESGIAVHREVGNRRSEGIVVASLGNVRQAQRRFDEAEDCFRAALAIHREVGNRRLEGNALGHLGSVYSAQERNDDAREHYEAALAILREVGYRRFEGVALEHLANLAYSQGNMNEARRLYESARTIHHEVNNRRAEGVTLGLLGKTCLADGQFEKASVFLSRGEALLRATEFPVELAMLLCHVAELKRRTGDIAGAREVAAEVEAIATRAGVRSDSELVLALTQVQESLQPEEDR